MAESGQSVAGYTSRLHVRAAVLEGILEGVLVTADVVARKAFGASQAALVLMTMAPATVNTMAVLTAPLVEDADRRRLFLGAGVFGRLAFLMVAFALPPHLLPIFLVPIVMHALAQTVLIPAQNMLFQANYGLERRGRLFSRAATLAAIASGVTAMAAGKLLDSYPNAYRWLYPLGGTIGFIGCLVYGRIRLRRMGPVRPAAPRKEQSLAELFAIFSRDRLFRDWEIAFFLYGLGFMMMQPVFARFFVDDLGLGYSQVAFARGVAFFAAYVTALPLAGRLLDSVGIPMLGFYACLILCSFSISLTVVHSYGLLLASFLVYGAGMAGISLAWNLGPPYFARQRSSQSYMTVHVSLVGLRALIGHPLGGVLAATLGARTAFGCSTFLFAAGAAGMWHVARRTRAATAG